MDGFSSSYNQLDAITPRHAHACNCVGCCRKCGCCSTYPGHNAETCAKLARNNEERVAIFQAGRLKP